MNSGQHVFSETMMNNSLENYTISLKNIKLDEKPLIGYFTNRIPVELLHALSLQPTRILSLGNPQQGASERYIQVFACSWLRHIMDIGISQGYEALNGIIFSAGTCDSLQNFSDIWKKVFPDSWTYNLTFPVLIDCDLACEYLQNEFEALIEVLSSQFLEENAKFTLAQSIKLFNLKRAYLLKLANLVSERKMNYDQLSKLLLLSDIYPVETVNNYLEKKIKENSSLSKNLPESPRLIVVGGMFDNYKLFEVPEAEYIVADDLSFGTRNFNFQIPENSFIQRYSQTYLERIPDPTAFDMDKRITSLEKLIRGHNIDGVVLLAMKWCDPDAFEFVPIQNRLKALEIPFLNIETSPDLSNLQQIQTRLSAFIEILS